jgi:hypothetical protein
MGVSPVVFTVALISHGHPAYRIHGRDPHATTTIGCISKQH